MHLAFRV